MKKFHISYFPIKGTNLTIGLNIEAESMEVALTKFQEDYPNVEISYIHNKSI
jgi:hypothetical protein